MTRFMRFVLVRKGSGAAGPRHSTKLVLCAVCAMALFPSALAIAAASGSTSPAPSVASSATKKSPAVLKAAAKPAWQDLTPTEQSSLRPLAANWDSLREVQKRKWIAIALNYPRMSPAEQAKLHSRMSEWASLSQQQRERARLNFSESKQLTPTQKKANWQAYQALSAEDKQKLAAKGLGKPTGAATAAKPGPRQKLAAVPRSASTLKAATTKMTTSSQAINRNTLLPASPPSAEAETSAKD